MEGFGWKEEYLLGIPELDFQHKNIFDCIATIAGEELNKQKWFADSFTVQLVGLVHENFALEESLMRIMGYPELERHLEEHRQFGAEVHALAQQSLRVKAGVSVEALKFVQEWERDHVLKSDRHYVDYFSSSVRKGGRRSIDRIGPRLG